MTFRYPLKIAHSLLSVISSLPTTSIEVHGMGIFEKIFEVGNTMLDVMHACGNNIPHEMYGVTQDPFQMFVKTLSQTPNSQKQYANLLLAKAAEKPEMQRFTCNITPALYDPVRAEPYGVDFGNGIPFIDSFPTQQVRSWRNSISGLAPPSLPPRQFRGSIVGELSDDEPQVMENSGKTDSVWNDNTVLISENEISVPGIWV